MCEPSGTQNFVYHKWPIKIFPIVSFVFSHYGHFGVEGVAGGGGGGPWGEHPPTPTVYGHSNTSLAAPLPHQMRRGARAVPLTPPLTPSASLTQCPSAPAHHCDCARGAITRADHLEAREGHGHRLLHNARLEGAQQVCVQCDHCKADVVVLVVETFPAVKHFEVQPLSDVVEPERLVPNGAQGFVLHLRHKRNGYILTQCLWGRG